MKTLLFGGILFVFFLFAGHAHAQCQPIYGGGVTCAPAAGALIVNKAVLNPASNTFVHDMGVNDPRFAPGQTVTFRITVTNIGNTLLHGVRVFDVIPPFVAFTSPPINNGGNTTILLPAGDLAPGASHTFTVTATLQTAEFFPQNQAITCLSNQAQAKDVANHFAQDTSQFCIENIVPAPGLINVSPTPIPAVIPPVTQVPPTALPPTGADSLDYLALIPTGIGGALIRRVSKRILHKNKGGKKI